MYDIRTNAIWALAAIAAIGTSGYAISGWTVGSNEILSTSSTKGSSSFGLGDAISSMRPVVELLDEVDTTTSDVGEIGKYVRRSWADDILRKALLQTAVAQTTAAPLPAAATPQGWGGVANNLIQGTPVASVGGAGGSTGAGVSASAAGANRVVASSGSVGAIPLPTFGNKLTGLNGLGAMPSLSLPSATLPLQVSSLTTPSNTSANPAISTTAAIAAVPLPAGVLFLGSALLGLGVLRRRKG